MKIWITRQSAGSLHAGGLERCSVWFTKPVYLFACWDKYHLLDLPFESDESRGLGIYGWHIPGRGEPKSISFGTVFGYSEDHNEYKWFADLVWDKLKEHFNNTEFPLGWLNEERAGRSKEQDFILELDIKITI